ncbi:MAG: ATP-binding cassette domain-containing protein, partial [Phycisphaerales bacterium]|nr:ATP-binding cassette domain-containing protein [Phycisphaerales bacterium]
SRKALAGGADMLRASTEALQGLRVVKVHTTERYEEGRFHRINKEVMRQLFKARAARALASPLNEVIVIFVMGTLAAVATKQIMDGRLEASSFIAGLGALAVAGASLKPLNGIFNEIQTASAAADRLEQLLNADEEAGHDAALPRLPRHAQEIRFEHVTFTYQNADAPSLRGVSVAIPHGQTVAVVGPNGSGKTTLLSLVPRLFEPDRPTAPDEIGADQPAGGVLIDGHDISTVSVRSLRRQIGVVTQETVLFRATIADNIAYGAENATDERIRAAARAARALGLRVALIDRADFPRDKLCGGLVSGRSLALLDRLFDLSADGLLFHAEARVAFHWAGTPLARFTLDAPLHFTMRRAFDARLRAIALEAGAIPFTASVDAMAPDGTLALSDGTTVRASCLVGADGVNSTLARRLFGRAFDPETIGFGLEVEWPTALAEPETVIDFGAADWGYGWMFPKAQGTT